MNTQRGRLVIVGAYVIPEIFRERQLSSLNVASSNRIERLASAIHSAGCAVTVLSPGTTPRMRFCGRLVHARRRHCVEGVEVMFAPALGLPMFGALFAPLILLFELCRYMYRHPNTAILGYNYAPGTAICCFVAKMIFRARVLVDVEDVCVPSWRDWVGRGDSKPVLQLYGWFLMRGSCAIADVVICPTSKFLDYIGRPRVAEVIRGCIRISRDAARFGYVRQNIAEFDSSLNVLYSGLVSEQNGARLLAATLEQLDLIPEQAKKYSFQICGEGPYLEHLVRRVAVLRNVNVVVHGFVSRDEYERILNQSDVCLVLQDPRGRHARFKTPSKAYEYMACGKAVIVTSVGDFDQLPRDTRRILGDYSPGGLVVALGELSGDVRKALGHAAAEFALQHWSEVVVGAKLARLAEFSGTSMRSPK